MSKHGWRPLGYVVAGLEAEYRADEDVVAIRAAIPPDPALDGVFGRAGDARMEHSAEYVLTREAADRLMGMFPPERFAVRPCCRPKLRAPQRKPPARQRKPRKR